MANSYTEEGNNLMLDGNAVAGLLQAVFGREMTASEAECGNCGNVGELGALMAYTGARQRAALPGLQGSHAAHRANAKRDHF